MMKHKVIWYSFTILCLLLSVSMPLSTTEQGIPEIIVSPEFIEIDLRGGEYNITILTVTWTGKDAILCNISTDIEPDGEGITVTYSEPSPFDLPSKVDYIVNMTVEVAQNLMPGTYIITTTFSCEAEKPPQPPSPPPPSRPYPPSSDILPVADASAGEPYTAYVAEEIMFDGSLSYDDGYIKSWYWDFGDGTNGTGETTTHNYSNPGIYNVTLTVKDDQGYTNTYETTVEIKTANRPPFNPEVNGPRNGTKNTNYTYTAVSTDLDNDTLRYLFDWGDDNMTTTSFLSNGTMQTHFWAAWGIYVVSVKAHDNKTESGITEYVVLIDVFYVKHIGYLIDVNADGVYDLFYSNATGNETAVELQDNGKYLIDGMYEYDPETGVLALYDDVPPPVEDDGLICYTLLAIAIVAVVISILIHVIFFKEKKKKKKKATKKARLNVGITDLSKYIKSKKKK